MYKVSINFNLIKLFVGFKKNILWFEISMNDIIFVAIINAREHLFDEHGSILFSELTSGHDLVEQLTTLADISDDVVPLLVLEELVHLDDVGVVLEEEIWLDDMTRQRSADTTEGL